MSAESVKTNLDIYKALRWIDAAAETFETERAAKRMQRLAELHGTQSDSVHKSLRTAAVSFLQAQKNFDALKQRASKSVRA